ncbi:metallophosphoesterase, partial [Enterobacter hormaechei]|nr:metallophosphoesterase [Enterobacter hormaechei]
RNLDEGIDWIAGANIDLIIHLGDVTANGVIAPEQFATAAQVLGRVRVPLLALPGNHDVGDPTSGHEAPLSIKQIHAFCDAFGPDRWVHTSGAWTLIGLNAQVLGSDLEREQIAWLAEAAGAARGPVALFLHKPWFDTGLEEPSLPPTRYVPPSSLRALRSTLAGADLRLVASGHVHQVRRRIV